MEKLKSEGTCLFCQKAFSMSTITRHLNTHLKKLDTPQMNEKSYHLKIERNPKYGKDNYFLNLLVSDKAKLGDIDDYLRSIWLECCGHMSSFTDSETAKNARKNPFSFDLLSNKSFDQDYGKLDMTKKVLKTLYDGQKIIYEYDFGTTTSLLITVASVLPIKSTEKITLLSRNEPLEIFCDICKIEPATEICTIHIYDEGDSMFCKKCAKKHAKTCEDFVDYAAATVVNSPRMGECAYEGGSIDCERDGVFQKNNNQ